MALRFEYLAYIHLVILIALGLQFPFAQAVLDNISQSVEFFELTESELEQFCLYIDVILYETILLERPKYFKPRLQKRPIYFLDHMYRSLYTTLECSGRIISENCHFFVSETMISVLGIDTANSLISTYNPAASPMTTDFGLPDASLQKRFAELPSRFPDAKLFRFNHLLPKNKPLYNHISPDPNEPHPKKARCSISKQQERNLVSSLLLKGSN